MLMAAIFVLQLLATAIGGALFWRRHQALRTEVLALREDLRSLEARAAVTLRSRKRAEAGAAEIAAPTIALSEPPLERARKRWRLAPSVADSSPARLDASSLRVAALAIAGAAPAFALFFGVAPAIVIAAGLFVAASLVIAALRHEWPHAGPAGLVFALLWCGFALGLGVGAAAPDVMAPPLAALGGAALLLAHVRHNRISLAIAGVAAVAMLAISWQTSFIGPTGLAFAATAVGAAMIGANSLRLETLFVGAFIASLAGLLGLSGQPSAAIWFTPVVALQGALFLAIAAVRVPQLGARGALIAGVAALSALGSALALHLSQHGLANNIAAAGVFAAIGFAFAGVIAAASQRRDRGPAPLKLTLWVLALSVLLAFAGAIGLAAAPLFAAPTAGLLALAAVVLDRYRPAAAWRACAFLALALALFHAVAAAQQMLAETPLWPPLALLGFGVAAPALAAAFTAHLAHQSERALTAAVAEAAAIVLALAAASLALRLACAGGALMLTPISFAEAGGHLTLWLCAALACGARDRLGAAALRTGAAHVLGASAAIAIAVAGGLWMSDYWSARTPAAGLLSYEPMGFLLPTLAAGAHWIFWRARDRFVQTRIAFGVFAATAAGFATLATLRVEDQSETLRALVCAAIIGLAIAANFAPGIAMGATPVKRKRRPRPQNA